MEQFSNPDWNKMERSFGFPTAARYGNCVERSRMFQERSMCSAASGELFRRSGNFIGTFAKRSKNNFGTLFNPSIFQPLNRSGSVVYFRFSTLRTFLERISNPNGNIFLN